jgi:predicted Zn-dependent protease with MMP-like domain
VLDCVSGAFTIRARGVKPMSSQVWRHAMAPSLADFEELAAEAWDGLPDHFRSVCGSIAIRIEDFPADDVLDDLEIESPYDLMGLYSGVSLDKKSVGDTSQAPDMVLLYRRPILDYWAEHEEALGTIISHVLIHEIGHHFGLSDADMERIERQADA